MENFFVNYLRLKHLGLEFIYLTNSTICYPKHNHTTTFTLNLLLKGEITLDKQSLSYNYKKDDCFLICPYEVHSISTKNSYDMISLCISTAFIQNYEIKKACNIIKNIASKTLVDKISPDNLNKMLKMFKQIYKNYAKQIIKLNSNINLTRLYSNNPEKSLYLNQTAKLMHTSKYHFIRKFKKTIGLTPHKFHLQKRIRLAQNMLDNKTPLIDTALATGFYDQSHFIRHFKNIVGITPTKYQQAATLK